MRILILFFVLTSIANGFTENNCITIYGNDQIFGNSWLDGMTSVGKWEHRRSTWVKVNSLNFELNQSLLSKSDLNLMKRHAKALVSIQDFMANANFFNPRFRLGLDTYHEAWAGLRRALPMIEPELYPALKINPRNPQHTLELMEKIMAHNSTTVFFVPRAVLTHPEKNATANELQWLLDDRSGARMQHTIFVFGAYNVMTDIGYWNLGLDFPENSPDYSTNRALVLESIYKSMIKQKK